jgi:sarcosine oxidase, subunit beta
MIETADIVIAGAGVLGLCAALQIAKRSSAKIIVLEKGGGPGEGSTGSSSAVCRTKYSLDSTVILARDGIAAYRHWSEFVEFSDPVARYHQTGALWLGNGNTSAETAKEAGRLESLGIAVETMDDVGLAERYPAINPCSLAPDLVNGEPHDCAAGGVHLLETEAGYVDPMDALQDLLRAVRAQGVDVRFRAEVTGVEMRSGAVAGVRWSKGEIAAPILINAAGPWCNALNGFVGLECPWPLRPTRIQIVHIDRPDSVIGPLPSCADPLGGIYFRPQNRGQQIVIGSVLEEDEREFVDPDEFDRGVDHDFAAIKLHALQHRLRGLDQLRGVSGYSGLYTINDVDVHPIVGATPIGGYFVANGCSGHGFKLAPAIGSLLAQAIIGQRIAGDTEVDASALGYDRAPIEIATRSVLA